MKFDKPITALLIVLLVLAVSATVYIVVNPNPGEKFTELYILGADNLAGNYSTNLNLNESANVTVGIVNHEQATTTYNLVTNLNGNILTSVNYTLSNNETKLINYTYTPTSTGTNQKLEFDLYKLPDTTNVYRSVFLYLQVT
jgi:uncharacterized membrane protein